MTKNSQSVYKFFYFFLATVPQIIAMLFSFSVTLNIIALFRDSSDKNNVYVIALVGALIWAIMLVFLRFSGAFSNMGIHLSNFRTDVLGILGYAFLAGAI